MRLVGCFRQDVMPVRPGALGRRVNLGNDSPESVNALVTAIEAACGRKAQRIDTPMPLGDVPKTWADNSASRRDLGYAPTIHLDEGIRRFVAWYRDYAKV